MLCIPWWKRHVEEEIWWSQLRIYVTYWPNYLCTISSFILFPKHSEVFCMCTLFEKGRCLKWNTLLALLIFHPNIVICFNKYVVFPVWVVDSFCADPEANVEFGSMKHGQLIVSTFTQLYLMCSFAILIQKPGIVWEKTCRLQEELVSIFKCRYLYSSPQVLVLDWISIFFRMQYTSSFF